jgi:hypothetical protein
MSAPINFPFCENLFTAKSGGAHRNPHNFKDLARIQCIERASAYNS